MRTDLDSLNPGKAVAQGAHAANKAIRMARLKDDPALDALLDEWEAQARGQFFGTTITLGCSAVQMNEIVTCAEDLHLHAGIVHDPTYPVRDGVETYLVPLDTCGYLFGRKSAFADILFDLKLMP